MSASPTPAADPAAVDDPYLWLEDVDSDAALAWVRARNAESRALLEAEPSFDAMRRGFLRVLDSRERIPYVVRRGDHLYNFWQDQDHPRGLWRRTLLAEYRKPQPAWDVLLDLDALATAEGENWVWAGADVLGPAYRHALLSMSRGGADAHVVREFDIDTRRFVDGGFALPEAKSTLEWIDADTIYVGTDFGPGSLTESGYPRVIKRWSRGQPLSDAVTVFEAAHEDVAASVDVDHTPGFERTLFARSPDFYTSQISLLADGRLVPIDKPADATLNFWRAHVLLQLRSDWTVDGRTWPRGALLAAPADAYMQGVRRFDALFLPTPQRSLADYTATASRLVLTVLDNVASRIEEWTPGAQGWQQRNVAAPYPGTLSVSAWHDELVPNDALAEAYTITYTDFTTPDTLYLSQTGSDARDVLKARPAFFDADGMRAEQMFAVSKDGTRVPYFVVWPRGSTADGNNPTLLYGYGGFEVSLQPWYSGGYGQAWYDRGGVLVVANIRGGGEYGPAWHQAASKTHKQNSYDDFIAVAEDLVARGVTRPGKLGIVGGSNGGLLVGAAMVQRPDLFGAVVSQVPLLDMQRYHLLLAGASWMAEYGDPDDPAEWAAIRRYSPYQNLQRGVHYPKVLYTTSTRDDRVHPGHARKMVARMIEQEHPVLYYENIEGGHGGAADNAQRADLMALEFAYLWLQLGPGRTPAAAPTAPTPTAP